MKKRKLFDSQGRIFGVISVVDILAVLVAAVLALMLINRFVSPTDGSHYGNSDSGETSRNAKITYELCLSGLRSTSVSSILPGDTIYNPDTGNVMGTVVETRREPYIQLVNTLDGRVAEMPTEGYCDLYLTVEGSGSVVDGHCYLDGASELTRNITLSFLTCYVSSAGRLMAFSYEVDK